MIIGVKKADVQNVAGSAEAEVRRIIEDNSRPSDPVIYTDGSVQRGVKSGWGFIVHRAGKVIHKASGGSGVTTSSTRMEIEAVSKALEWLKDSSDASTKHVVIVTDSQNVLKRVESRTLRKEWFGYIGGCPLKKITWIYSPSHTGVEGNEAADKLASNAPLNSSLTMDKGDVMRALASLLENEEVTENEIAVSRLTERGVTRGSGRHSMLAGTSRRVFNQISTGTISRWTLKWILDQGVEQIWQCPQCNETVPGTK